MATLGTMLVRMGVDDRDLVRTFQRDTRVIENFAEAAERAGSRLSMSFTAPIVAMATAVGIATARVDALQRGLTAALGNVGAAKSQIDQFAEVAKLPAISYEGALRYGMVFQNMNATLPETIRLMKGVGNAVALSGEGAQSFENVMRQLGQVRSLGRLLGEELTDILQNAPAIGGALQAGFGTLNPEKIREMGLSTDKFFQRLSKGLETLPTVTGGLQNAFENLSQAARRSLGTILGGGDVENLVRFIDRLSERVEYAGAVFRNLSPATRNFALGMAGLAAAAGPASFVIGRLAGGFIAVRGALVALQTLPGRMAGQFATLRNQVIATQAGLNFNVAAGRFQSAAGTFVSSTRAMSLAAVGMSRTAAVTRIAISGIVGVIFSPGGLLIALSLAAAAFTHYQTKAAQARAATEEFKSSLAGMAEETLQIQQAGLETELAIAEGTLRQLEERSRKVSEVMKLGTGEVVLTGGVTVVRPKGYEEAAAAVKDYRDKLLAVEHALEAVRAASAQPPKPPEVDESAMDKLVSQTKLLLGLYDARLQLNRGAVSALGDLVAQEEKLAQVIRAQGNRRTEDLEKALALTGEINQRWDAIFATIQATVTTRPEEPGQVADPNGYGRVLDVVQVRANELATSFQAVAVAAQGAERIVSVADRIHGAARAFEIGMGRASQGGIQGIDRVSVALYDFAERLGATIGRIQSAINDPLGSVMSGLGGIGKTAMAVIGRLGSIVNPLTLFGSTIDQIMRNLAPDFEAALAPLTAVFVGLGEALTPIIAVIANALYPVLEALIPIIESLGPVIGAIARTLSPLIVALVPLLDVFRIVLETLFPVIKTVAIILTYFGQIIFSVAGGIAIAIGSLIEALGAALDKIPWMGDFGLRRLGRGIKETGQTFLDTVDALGDAREQIEQVEIGGALEGVAGAARKASAALSNVPELFELAFRSRQAALGFAPSAQSPLRATDLGGSVPASDGGVHFHFHGLSAGVSRGAVTSGVRDAIRDDPEVRTLILRATAR